MVNGQWSPVWLLFIRHWNSLHFSILDNWNGHSFQQLPWGPLFYSVCVCVRVHSVMSNRLFVTPCTVAHVGPLSMEFPKQKYWSGLPFPSPGDLPDPGIKPVSPALAGGFLTIEPPGKPYCITYGCIKPILDFHFFCSCG